jgi:hypothetical protein
MHVETADSSVSRGIGVEFVAGARDFSLLHNVQIIVPLLAPLLYQITIRHLA